jgi:hypothetical protein
MVGEVLADRYRLEEHINNDAAGRQIWRGVDVILRRPVAVVLRYPGGESAQEMLSAAVAASRVTHSHLVGVYDAIDEGERAYVVREWVDGAALREYVAQAPFDAGRATTVGHAVASAIAAVHATGMVHGNIHPGSVLIGTDGRVVLADARADDAASEKGDIRAVGAIVYFALTGHWPHAELPNHTGSKSLPDAVRDANGTLAAPRQIRAGVPAYLDELVTDLLNPSLTLPSAEALAAELGRLDAEAEVEADASYYEPENAFGLGGFRSTNTAEAPRPVGRKVAVGIVALVLVAAAGVLISTRFLPSAGAGPPGSPNANQTSAGSSQTGPGNPTPIILNKDSVRVIDPGGDRTELKDVALAVDGNPETGWTTQHYKRPRFGDIAKKPGMGILIKLSQPQKVSVEVTLSASGASADLRVGTADQPSTSEGDKAIYDTYKLVGEPITNGGVTMVFSLEEPAQYLLFWITSLPKDGNDGYQIGVQEIVIHPLA